MSDYERQLFLALVIAALLFEIVMISRRILCLYEIERETNEILAAQMRERDRKI